MKGIVLSFFLSAIAVICSAQTNKKLLGDTTFWYRYQNETADKLKLPRLITSNDSIHLRYWASRQTVDIWTIDGKIFTGMVTSFVNSYEERKDGQYHKPSKIFKQQIVLDNATAKKAFTLAQEIKNIPTEKSIIGWVQGLDGEEFIFETATPNTYDFKTYWTPHAQDSSLVEAKKIIAFIKNIDALSDLKRKYRDFFATLAPGTYSDIGSGMAIIKLNQSQKTRREKTKANNIYLNSVNDEVAVFLTDTLTKIFARHGEVQSDDAFFLHFSKNNKLLKITTDSDLTDKEDKAQFKRCKKRIFDAFKLVKAEFLHSSTPYQIRVVFILGEVHIEQLSGE